MTEQPRTVEDQLVDIQVRLGVIERMFEERTRAILEAVSGLSARVGALEEWQHKVYSDMGRVEERVKLAAWAGSVVFAAIVSVAVGVLFK